MYMYVCMYVCMYIYIYIYIYICLTSQALADGRGHGAASRLANRRLDGLLHLGDSKDNTV